MAENPSIKKPRELTPAQKQINDDPLYWDWFDAWWEKGFSWDGLKQYEIEWNATRTLQDYWREEQDKLIPFAGRKWTRFHLPPHDPSGEETSEKFEFDEDDWKKPEWQSWHMAITQKLDKASEYTYRNPDTRAQFTGICFPAHFSLAASEDETAAQKQALHIRANWAQLGDHANFTKAQFGNQASFTKAQFGHAANFTEAQFGDWANFTETQFGDMADFTEAQFGDMARFTKAQFRAWTKFTEAQFGERADFTEAHLGYRPNFTEAQFGAWTNFSETQFGGDTYFAKVQFRGEADFTEAQFGDWADFTEAQFGEWARFSKAQFGDHADFTEAQFEERAEFTEAQFGRLVKFTKAQFGDWAKFTEAQFGSGARFTKAQFDGDCTFSNIPTETAKKAIQQVRGLSFAGVHFYGHADFTDRSFPKDTDFSNAHFHYLAKFHGCTFHPDTNFAEARFELPERGARHIESTAERYQNAFQILRQHMETLRNHGQELKFAKLEAQARERRVGSTDFPRWARMLSWVYGLFCDYGQSAIRPLVGLTASWGAASLVYAFIGGGLNHLTDGMGVAAQFALPPISTFSAGFFESETITVFEQALLDHPFLTRAVMFTHAVFSAAMVFFLLLALKRRFQIR